MSDLATFDVLGEGLRFGVDAGGRTFAVAADIARALGYRDAANATRVVDEEERGTQIVSTPSGDQRMTVLYEEGIWELIFLSRKPEARAIKRRVKSILRELRETGTVSIPEQRGGELDELEVAERYVAALKRNRELEAANAELAPKAEAAEVLTEAHGDFPIGAAANMLGMGRTTLFKALYAEQVIQRDKRPYQRFAHWFRVVAGTHGRRDGTEETHYTSYVTGAGLVALHGFLVRRGYDVRRPEPSLAVVPGGA